MAFSVKGIDQVRESQGQEGGLAPALKCNQGLFLQASVNERIHASSNIRGGGATRVELTTSCDRFDPLAMEMRN